MLRGSSSQRSVGMGPAAGANLLSRPQSPPPVATDVGEPDEETSCSTMCCPDTTSRDGGASAVGARPGASAFVGRGPQEKDGNKK